jgi:hypothetical protein
MYIKDIESPTSAALQGRGRDPESAIPASTFVHTVGRFETRPNRK